MLRMTQPTSHGMSFARCRFIPIGVIAVLATLVRAAQPELPLGIPTRETPIEYRDLSAEDQLFPVNINNWWGYMNQKGDLVVPPQYDWLEEFYESMGRAVVRGRTGFIRASGDWAIEPQFIWADRFADGMAIVRTRQGGYGYIDLAGKPVTPPQWRGALRFSDGFAAVQTAQGCGYIDKRGKLVIPAQFLLARSFHEDLAAVEAPAGKGAGRLAYIDKRGAPIFVDREGRFTDLGDFRDGWARVRVGKLWGYMDKSFTVQIAPRFQDARDFCDGVAAVQLEGRWGYIDKAGNWIISPRFERAFDFSQDVGLVQVDRKYGFVDKAGAWRVEAQYEWADPFRRDLARAGIAPNFGYIGLTGRYFWHPQWPSRGIVNRTVRARARQELQRPIRSVPMLELPPLREPASPGYPPDWQYRDRDYLPQPQK